MTHCREERIALLRRKWNEAAAIVVGAGAGLSTAAGFTYGGERFHAHFADFEEVYGFHDMYTGGFYPFPSAEIFWAYWSRFIMLNRYDQPAGKPYETLLRLLGGKDHFVITTNVDHRFQTAGFAEERLFCTQGDYGLWQCSLPCCARTYGNEAAVREMVRTQRNMRIPSALIPHCPVCGRPMTTNLRADDTFVEDEAWHAAAARYQTFLETHRGKGVLFLELGVGMNTPGIIKYPFWRMTARDPSAWYACLNLEAAYAPREIATRSVCIGGDLGEVLARLEGSDEGE